MYRSLFGEANAGLAATYYELAEIYIADGNYDRATDLLHKSLAIDKKLLGETHSYVANIEGQLALVYTKKNELAVYLLQITGDKSSNSSIRV